MLSASVISAAIANKLPSPGSIYVSQSLRFRAPVRDRHGQRDDPSEISGLAPHGLRGWRTGGDRGRGPGRTPCSLSPRISQSGRVRKRGCPCRRSSTEAAAGQFNVSRDTRGTGTAPTTISRRGQ
jgi:hypothetical protein